MTPDKKSTEDKLPLKQVHQYLHLQGLVCHPLLQPEVACCHRSQQAESPLSFGLIAYSPDQNVGLGEKGP